MKIPWRYAPLTLVTVFFVFVNIAMQQLHICQDLLGIENPRCISPFLDNFGFSVFIFANFALLTGLFLTGIRSSLIRAWLAPALIYCLFALFLIINIGPVKNEEQLLAGWLGIIFYFGTIGITLMATAVARARESKPVIAMDGIAKLLLLLPLTYFVFHITVFAFGNYFSNTLM